MVYSIGYQLSFSAAFGFAYLYPLFRDVLGMRVLGVGLAAWLASLPFQTAFYVVSPWGILLTPVFSTFLVVLLPGTLLAYFLNFCFLSDILLYGISPILRLMVFLLDAMKNNSLIHGLQTYTLLTFPRASLLKGLFYGSVLGILVWLGSKIWKKRTAHTILVWIILVLLVAFLALPIPPRGLEIVFLNVGQGDATLVRCPGFSMLVDTGTESAGKYAVLPFLRSKKIEKLDVLVLTHTDEDHIGGARELLSSMKIGYVMFSAASKADVYADEGALLRLFEEKGIPYGFHKRGDGFKMNDLLVCVLSPKVDGRKSMLGSNEGSLVLGVKQDDFYLQLTGDVEGAMLENLIHEVKEKYIYLMKAPHHGSRNSLDEEIYDALYPDLVVYSCGNNNRYGHPHREVVEYWEARGVRSYRTDEMGELFFRFQNHVLSLEN